MILAKLLNGWPDRITSKDHVGAVPDGFISFVDIADMDRWKAENTALVPPVKTPPEPVPSEVPLWTFRAVLTAIPLPDSNIMGFRNPLLTLRSVFTAMGLDSRVDEYIALLDEPKRTHLKVYWAHGQIIGRGHELVGSVGLTDAELDSVFRDSEQLGKS